MPVQIFTISRRHYCKPLWPACIDLRYRHCMCKASGLLIVFIYLYVYVFICLLIYFSQTTAKYPIKTEDNVTTKYMYLAHIFLKSFRSSLHRFPKICYFSFRSRCYKFWRVVTSWAGCWAMSSRVIHLVMGFQFMHGIYVISRQPEYLELENTLNRHNSASEGLETQ